MKLASTSLGLSRARHVFMDFTPGVNQLIKIRWLRRTIKALSASRGIYEVLRGAKDLSSIAGRSLGNGINHRLCSPIYSGMSSSYKSARLRGVRNIFRGHGATHRTWMEYSSSDSSKRVVKPLQIMYHDANRAGAHLDVHLGQQSIVVRVSGKPVEKQLKFNSKGVLTEDSKKLLLNHLRSEIGNNSRVVHNHDHTVSNAGCTWLKPIAEGYGSGKTRQPVLIDKAELYRGHI